MTGKIFSATSESRDAIRRNQFDQQIGKIAEIAEKYPKNGSFADSVSKIKAARDFFDVKVMVVGHFSAGKSALLNNFIGRPDFLKEAQLPQTAVATELVYDQEEKYVMYPVDGAAKEIDDPNDFDTANCEHLELRLSAESLKRVRDFTIVDTPGFDSGIARHNEALSAYLGHGSAFILVLSAEKGDIDQDALNFLEEIAKYSRYLAVVISKSDKRGEDTALEIREQVEGTLLLAGHECPVICSNKFDPELPEKLLSVLAGFDAQQIFDTQLKKIIRAEAICIESSLEIMERHNYLDTFEAEMEIRKYQRLQQQLKETFETRKKKLQNNCADMVEEVIAEVRGALVNRAGVFADAVLSGGTTGLEALVVETIRPVLIASVKEFSGRQLTETVKAINLDFETVFADRGESKPLSDIITETAKNFKSLIDEGVFSKSLGKYANAPENKQKTDKGRNIYQVVTAVAAVLTDVVAPWLEVIIVLLPNIMSLLNEIFGESDRDKVKKAFLNNIIPQITERLYPEVEKVVESTQTALLDNLEEEVNIKLNGIGEALAETQGRKTAKETEYRESKEYFETSRKALNDIATEMEDC